MVKIGGSVRIKKIAVTGGIASGKTTVCRLLQSYGACVISADEIAHKLLTSQSTVYTQVIQLLGHEILTRGEIDRKKVAKQVFTNPLLLKKLQEILFPRIFEAIQNAYRAFETSYDGNIFVAEIPLLYEAGFEGFFDAVIAVKADEKICKKRFCASMGEDEHEYERRMKFHMDPTQKADRATYVITNNGSLEELTEKTKEIFHRVNEDGK